LVVTTSTVWPLCSFVFSGTMAPSTRAPAAPMAEVGVQRVGEVDRRRLGRKLDHGGLRREDVDAVIERRPGMSGVLLDEIPPHASSWRSTALRAWAICSSNSPLALTPA
jgi:hypothetical protein